MTSFTTAFLLSIVSTFRRQNMIDEDVNLSTLLKDFETEKVTPPFSTKLMESAKTKQNIYYVSKLCLHRKCFKRHKSCHQYFFELFLDLLQQKPVVLFLNEKLQFLILLILVHLYLYEQQSLQFFQN